jgi:hypothetical protein
MIMRIKLEQNLAYDMNEWIKTVVGVSLLCSEAIVSARAQDLLRLPESMTILKNRTG